MAVVTASVPQHVLLSVFSGLANHISTAQLDPFISNMHTALWTLAAISFLGAAVAATRPAETEVDPGLEQRRVRPQPATTA